MSETLGSLLFPDREALASSLREIEKNGKLDTVLGPKERAVLAAGGHALDDAVRQSLDVPISEVLVRAWATYKKLREAVETADPEKMIHFDLGENTIRSEHHPRIELRAAEQIVGALTFDLELSLTFQLGRLQIQHRRVMRATTGTCVGEAKLSVSGVPIASRPTREMALPGEMSFGEGIQIFAHS